MSDQKYFTPFLIFSLFFLAGAVFFCFYGFYRFMPLDEEKAFKPMYFIIPSCLIFAMIYNIWEGRKPRLFPYGTTLWGWVMRPQEVLLLLAIAFILIGAPVVLNALLDKSEPTVHPALVLEKWTQAKNKDHYIHLQSWRRSGDELIRIDKQTWSQISPRQTTLMVTTKTGWLGWEWVVDIR